MRFVSYEQKIVLTDGDAMAYLRGDRLQEDDRAQPYFVYMVLPFEQLSRLNRDLENGEEVHLAEYGRVVLQANGMPNAEQKEYMERYYGFDHTDHFADDADNAAMLTESACAA